MVKDVPRADDVDAAGRGSNWGDRREAGEPFGAAADGFVAAVRQDEVDGGFDGVAVDAEELVGRGVAAGGVGGHAEALRNGLEALGFFANGAARAPPPGLVDEGSVGGVHEANDAVIDVAGEIGGEVGGAVFFAEFGERGQLRCFDLFAGSRAGDVDPRVAVLFHAGIGGCIDACGVEFV